MSTQYDYIITGMGCAGLSLAIHFIHSGKFSEKKILLVDKDSKQSNDRTWCFWEKDTGLFDSIVYHRYPKAWVHGEGNSRLLDLQPYEYKLIRGIDFYNYCLGIISQQPNFSIVTGNIDAVENCNGHAQVRCNGQTFTTQYIFNSVLFKKPELKNNELWLLQHFKGWVIETGNKIFSTAEATLMDFRVPQTHGTSFVYIMPFSPTQALVEYTLFNDQLLADTQYEEALKNYIDNYIKPGNYRILEKEFGVIPMTNHKFSAVDGRIIQIGTAGGQTKGSSGYTFRFIQKHSARLVDSLVKKNNPFIPLPTGPARFRFYDSVLLRILKKQTYPGDKIFTTLFKKNDAAKVLRFLDNESSYTDELKIISSLPTWPFLRAAVKQL